jgi:hypothetical protein
LEVRSTEEMIQPIVIYNLSMFPRKEVLKNNELGCFLKILRITSSLL